ncbi:MAG: DUF4129 domain-containing protein [Acidimicrobiales bacterium]|nr:DUF4129 domain-containing protein [Acidimicrobiales bacterium]
MAEELPEDLRQRADEVLAQDKFAPEEPGLLDRAWERVIELISDLLSVVADSTVFGGVAIGWIILAAMVGLIVFFLYRYLPRYGSSGRRSVEPTIVVERAHRSRDEWLAEARDAESAGRYREAVRARYRAMVAGLVDRGEIPEDPGATPNELRSAFGGSERRTAPFGSATAAYSDVWYGGDRAERADSERFATWDSDVMTEGGSQ